MQTIPFINLLIAFLPVIIVITILQIWSKDSKETLYAFARMLLQLSVIGYGLIYLFEVETSWVIMLVLTAMALIASWIALRTTKIPKHILFPLAFLSIALGGGVTLFIITQGVLELEPWYTPRYTVPLAGMIFSTSMTGVSLAAERFEAEIRQGAVYTVARSTALKAALIPITNSLLAVGLVSLPGMMTGQILSGVSPLIAARYQIMVMCMMYGAAGLSCTCFLHLLKSRTALIKT